MKNRDHDSRENTSPPLTSTHEEQSLRVSDSQQESRNNTAATPLTEPPAQKGNILRISTIDQAVQPRYLYDPEKDDTDLIDRERMTTTKKNMGTKAILLGGNHIRI